MKLRKSVKVVSLLFLMALSMGIAMSIGRVGEETHAAGDAGITGDAGTAGTTGTAVSESAVAKETDAGKPADNIGQRGQTGKENENKEIPGFPMSDSYSFVKSLMALMFVLGLIFLAAYLFKKFMGINTSGLRTNRVPIHMVGNLPLGDKKFLSIVEIQGKHYFIGISPGSINLLSELDLEMPQETGTPGNEGHGFESILRKARSLLNNRQPNYGKEK